MKNDYTGVLGNFDISGGVLSCDRFGEGHINDTYLVTTDCRRYILQRINGNLFQNIPALMDNIRSVSEFIKEKVLVSGGDTARECLTLVYCRDKKPYYFDGTHYFRVYHFIENTTAYQRVEKPEHFYQSAVAFGNFAHLLSDFKAGTLYETIPHFHDTAVRLDHFIGTVNGDRLNRAKEAADEIDFVLKRAHCCDIITRKLAAGEIPLKVTHNDTKLNNVLIDNDTGKAVAVIDLDTVMPGSILYDFGDAIRFGCSAAAEDEPDLRKVCFVPALFSTYAQGYLTALGDSVTKTEKEYMAFGAVLMTLECGMRFLDDYIGGDTYFKIHRPKQNLDRARTQLKLVSDMEKQLDQMNAVIGRIQL